MPADDVRIPKWLWGIVVAATIAWMGWVSVQIQTQSNSQVEVKTILSAMVARDNQDYNAYNQLQTTVTELRIKVEHLEQKVGKQ
jgi:hypothetical protein